MSTFGGEAEWQPSIAGEPSAGPHSHNHQPSQEFPIYTLYLENLGAQFTSPSTSRRESYDTNLSGDEAFAQPEASATPRADHTSWLSETPNGGRLTQPPPTPRLTLVHELPYLTRPEYTEFERRRRAERNRRKPAFDPHRSALEDTPRGSPTGTACTSVSGIEELAHHHHGQVDISDDHTPSQWSSGSHELKNNIRDDNQDGGFGPYLHQGSHHHFPEDAYNDTAGSEAMPMSMASPWRAGSAAPQDDGL